MGHHTHKLIPISLAITLGNLPAQPISLSGIYPHLTMYNQEGECGTGALVPWAGRLWAVTYAPHAPKGSSDKLYEITPDLRQTIRSESIGGTPANRLVHKESQQLFIGPYAIDNAGKVRTIPYSKMFGRPTGNARHLTDPENKILYATMEEGIYEVGTKTLQVTELWADEQRKTNARKAKLPGYHGKGFYSGQGVYVYSNNGERGSAALKNPETPSGVLAEWDGKADTWTVIRRNQFTEVTGPGGIVGNPTPATDPIWSIGWDDKSLILASRHHQNGWNFFRLPKGSHSYDGAHGWNTEWPRIRDINQDHYLMTMHGTFWQFPKSFTASSSTGLTPMSNYLKVIGDFTHWNDHIVFGCDDTAKNEFLNKRKAKGHIPAPQSQSNLWFVKPNQLKQLGPAIGRGMVWRSENLTKNQTSDPFLFSGYDHRGLHLHHQSQKPQEFSLEVDKDGSNQWTHLRTVTVPASGYLFVPFHQTEQGSWIRIKNTKPCSSVTAAFSYRNHDSRSASSDPIFDGLAESNTSISAGVVRARGGNKQDLAFAAVNEDNDPIGFYLLNDKLELNESADTKAYTFEQTKNTIPNSALSIDSASVIYTDENGKIWRLPKGDPSMGHHPLSTYRVAREVATERDLLNAHGTFYELPARNAGGISKVRAVATHNRYIHDFCSYRGLFILSGVSNQSSAKNPHIIRSKDNKVALWAGAVDDIWKLGKPRGKGGPWLNTQVKANTPSDPFLMTGFDKKSITLQSTTDTKLTIQVDLDGTGHWVTYKTIQLQPNKIHTHHFDEAFQAYWLRTITDSDTQASAQLTYQ
ncbi:hypothetical protein [Rubritalea tangerina]|uniref:Uncharacterized protein n=1 Tax=Rubritalea tangerina TaxID=430798 RepID=A0ABW4ZEY1_9BACT